MLECYNITKDLSQTCGMHHPGDRVVPECTRAPRMKPVMLRGPSGTGSTASLYCLSHPCKCKLPHPCMLIHLWVMKQINLLVT